MSKSNHKKALERIQKYYSYQEKYLNVFKHHTMSITEAQMYRYDRVSPYRMENNSMVIITKPGNKMLLREISFMSQGLFVEGDIDKTATDGMMPKSNIF